MEPGDIEEKELRKVMDIYCQLSEEGRFLWMRDAVTLLLSDKLHNNKHKVYLENE